MAAYGGSEAIRALGNQVYICLVRKEQPVEVLSLRAKYEDTLDTIRGKICALSGLEPERQQLFHRGHELRTDDHRTLLEMEIHTGFSLRCYDKGEDPVYWPPVERGDDGLLHVVRHGSSSPMTGSTH